ncbi:MAG TPA: hypothetical protein VH561_07275 [Micromonosporaceae bacterium]|jgi:hypothetical protein
MQDELVGGPPAPGLVRRLLGPRAGSAATPALVAGLVGVAALIAALVLDWQHVTFSQDPDIVSTTEGDPSNLTLALGLSGSGLSGVYALGVIGLIALVGLAISRPDLAAGARLAASGVGLGVGGVVVAMIIQMRHWVTQLYEGGGLTAAVVSGNSDSLQQLMDNSRFTVQPGLYAGGAAVVVLVAGVWLAARPARSPLPAAPAEVASTATAPLAPAPAVQTSPPAPPVEQPAAPPSLYGPPSPAPEWSRQEATRVGYADGLSVAPAGSVDIGTQTDILRN